jgi:CubicO group peptidase (beta-lactamase class C family)
MAGPRRRLGLVLAAALVVAPAGAFAQGTGPPPAPAAAGLPPATVRAIGELVSTEMSRRGIPGLSLAIGAAGELWLEAAFGSADVENDVPARPATAFRLASVSKPMTAVAVLQLAEERRLDLDAPVWRYCPAYPARPSPVTARLLLSHQGGVRGYRRDERPETRPYESVAEGLALFAGDPLAYEPGTAVAYSTYGYNLLGCAVEGAAGRAFAEVLAERVFSPAGMTSTRPEDLRSLLPGRPSGYFRGPAGELRNSRLADMSYKVPGGGLVGTAGDAARFGLALLSGRLLRPETLREMLTPQRTRTGRSTGFGLGLTVGMRDGRVEAWHTGGQERVSTVVYLRPDSGQVVALLSNLERVRPPLLELARRVADTASAAR